MQLFPLTLAINENAFIGLLFSVAPPTGRCLGDGKRPVDTEEAHMDMGRKWKTPLRSRRPGSNPIPSLQILKTLHLQT